MDTKGVISDHSQIKLDIYKHYLQSYLSVMLNTPYYLNIFVIEPFAGMGITKNGEKGSAFIAKQVVEDFIPKFYKKDKKIYLMLNDRDNYDFLIQNVEMRDFISFSNKEAKEFINEITPDIERSEKQHVLYFLDPFGYTSIPQQTFDLQIFKGPKKDILLFIPLTNIYRFKSSPNSIKQFLANFELEANDVAQCKSIKDLANLIRNSINIKMQTQYTNYKLIKNTSATNVWHSLFFTTKNEAGAHKFLESISKFEINHKQLTLFGEYIETSHEEELFIQELKAGTINNNILIYKKGILLGLLPSKTRNLLKKLENNGKINISEQTGYTRNKGAFPVDKKDSTVLKIGIIWNGK